MNTKDLLNLSIKVKNFKCFGETEQGFDRIKPINLIIGRNNSGKSTLLDMLNHVASNHPLNEDTQKKDGQAPEIIFESILKEDEVKKVFTEKYRIPDTKKRNAWESGPAIYCNPME